MGISYTVHIGPFVQCKKTKTVKSDRHRCGNSVCERHKQVFSYKDRSTNFCSKCGCAIETFQIDQNMNPYDLIEKMNEDLYVKNGNPADEYDVFLPNKQFRATKEEWRSFDPRFVDLCRPVSIDAPGIDLDEFKSRFATAIKLLMDTYGEEHVEICWGVVTDAR